MRAGRQPGKSSANAEDLDTGDRNVHQNSLQKSVLVKTSDKSIDYANKKRIQKEASNRRRYWRGKGNKPKDGKIKVDAEISVLQQHIVSEQIEEQYDLQASLELINDKSEEKITDVWYLPHNDGFYKDKGKYVYVPNVDLLLFKKNLIMNMYSFVNIPQFNACNVVIPVSRVLVHTTLYDVLYESIGILHTDFRNYEALRLKIGTLLKNFPTYIKNSLFIFYLYHNRSVSFPNQMLTAVQMTPYTLAKGVRSVIPRTESHINPYKINGKFNILKSNGFNFDTDRTGLLTNISFNTKEVKERMDWVKMFSIEPFKAFALPTFSEMCVCNAMSRIFKSRDLEEEYNSNQYKLLCGFPNKILNDVTSICGAIYEPMESRITTKKTMILTGTPKFRMKYSILSDKKDYYLDCLSRLRPSDKTLFWYSVRDYIKSSFGFLWDGVIDFIYSPLYMLFDRVDVLRARVSLPHPKSLLYRNYAEQEKTLINILTNNSRFKAQIKPELRKYGKADRLFLSNKECTLVNTVEAEVLKAMFKKEIDLVAESVLPQSVVTIYSRDNPLTSFKIVFSDAQSIQKSTLMYNEASNLQPGEAKFIYFSDDGYFVYNIDGHILGFETDIKSCDSSNGLPVFASLLLLADFSGIYDIAKKLCLQCALPFDVVNPSNEKEYVTLQSSTYYEKSGSALTTPANCAASFLIACSIYREIVTNGFDDPIMQLQRAAKDAGWEITVSLRHSFNAMTFLKNAYCIRERVAWGCLGKHLRSFGTVKGLENHDTYGWTLEEFKCSTDHFRAKRLIEMKMLELQPEPMSPFINALRVNLGLKPLPNIILLSDYIERYGGDELEWNRFLIMLEQLEFGVVMRCPIIELIYAFDYGTEYTEHQNFEVFRYIDPVLDVY